MGKSSSGKNISIEGGGSNNVSFPTGPKIQIKNSTAVLEIQEQKRKLLQQQRRNIIKAAARMREFQKKKNRVQKLSIINYLYLISFREKIATIIMFLIS